MIIPNECRENASYTPAEPCIPPEGTIEITENGLIDVAQFANANVNVSGGGASRLELLATTSLGTISTSSTTETDTGITTVLDTRDLYNDYEMLIVIVSSATKNNDSLVATLGVTFLYGDIEDAAIKTTSFTPSVKTNYRMSSDGTKMPSYSNNTSYGIYAKSSISGGALTLSYYTKYNSGRTGTIDNDFTARVYGLRLLDLI